MSTKTSHLLNFKDQFTQCKALKKVCHAKGNHTGLVWLCLEKNTILRLKVLTTHKGKSLCNEKGTTFQDKLHYRYLITATV